MGKQAVPKIFVSYNHAYALDEHFNSTGEGQLSKEQFYALVATFTAVGSPKKQEHTATLFKSLGKVEVVRRATIVAKMSKLLESINARRNDISNSLTPQT